MTLPSLIPLLLTSLAGLTMAATSNTPYTPAWLTLPETPTLPRSTHSAHASINNVSLWYALYGAPLGHAGAPIVLLHGGKISSRWYGHLIRALTPSHTVLAIDTRGHGRSTDDLSVPLSYTQFAADTITLLDKLHIKKASFIGWSDGANTALAIAMRYPSRADKIIPYGANFNPGQINGTSLALVPFGAELVAREQKEYEGLNADADWLKLKGRVEAMQAIEPAWTEKDFAKIPTLDEDPEAPLVLIATGDHEEAIVHSTPIRLQEMIPYSQLTVLPGMSHFGPIQDPETFIVVIKALLNKAR
ncbi:Alpha/Beta hydrolase protein [Aspergillus crustosus]